MTSLLRQIVAGPRAPHPESDLDLCYVTSDIIATSGPSQTWPKRAYRNPLDKLVEFLDERHQKEWAIWEFRAEGTGYPDDEVYGRVRHYPWPDHHPPPFRLVPMMMASMRNWLHGGGLHDHDHDHDHVPGHDSTNKTTRPQTETNNANTVNEKKHKSDKISRVVVVHCKAGKGRSGTISCSYLISERGWRPEEALTRFTERRMRPNFGAGVSIPSQLRTIVYVDRWTRHGKRYVDRPVEILEVHVWGLCDGVKVDVEGYVDNGRRIHSFHTFGRHERVIVEGDAPEAGGMAEMMFDFAGVPVARVEGAPDEAPYADSTNLDDPNGEAARAQEEMEKKQQQQQTQQNGGFISSTSKRFGGRTAALVQQARDKSGLLRRSLATEIQSQTQKKAQTAQSSAASSKSQLSGYSADEKNNGNGEQREDADVEPEPGGMAVILKPETPIRIPNSDVNISVERRNRSSSSLGLTMVTAVAHVWFNAFFEGNGPEQDGKPEEGGVFSIDWEAMDGIKGSSRKGAKALDRIAVVWRFADGDGAEGERLAGGGVPARGEQEEKKGAARIAGSEIPQVGEVVDEPAEGTPVQEMQPADWKGVNAEYPENEKGLGLRPANPASADVSKASSVKSQVVCRDGGDTDSMEGVRVSGPAGEDELEGDEAAERRRAGRGGGRREVGEIGEETPPRLPPRGCGGGGGEQPGTEIIEKPDTASGTTWNDRGGKEEGREK